MGSLCYVFSRVLFRRSCGKIIAQVFRGEVSDPKTGIKLRLQAGASGFTAPSRIFTEIFPPDELFRSSDNGDDVPIR